uniref:Cytochrome b n=2 Tax=Perna viridis TaxID=73031 RepID=I6QB16_PERVI|nr:cytochrome b [Perna viridis]AFK75944.1 cytochrome b [Perna viridis]UJM44258.1 cytochrome b [Perna viridis]
MSGNMLPLRKRHWLLKILNNSLYDLPCPINLNMFWSFGSMLGLCIVIQVVSGILLSLHFIPHEAMAFDSVYHIMRDVNKGWFLRNVHVGGCSMFFVCLYVHIGRGIYYGSYLSKHVWLVGVTLFLLVMAEAFLGYSLPWGQMSFWGVTVISNLFTVIPYISQNLLFTIWGHWSVSGYTLQRFFIFHFLLPFVIIVFSTLHLFFLHENGSNNPLGISSDSMCIPFHPFYTVKDIFGFVCFGWALMYFVCVNPELVVNKINYHPADPYHTPLQVEPEWYFLFAYAMLRSIPHKLSGVLALLASVTGLYLYPFIHTGKFRSFAFYPVSQMLFWCFVVNFLSLIWVGQMPVREPFISMGQVYTGIYFSTLIFPPMLTGLWDKLIFSS